MCFSRPSLFPVSPPPRFIIADQPLSPSLIVVDVVRQGFPARGRPKDTALFGSLGVFPLHFARPSPTTMVTVGQVPLGIVFSLLNLPQSRSSSVYSSWCPPSHRTTTIVGIFFSTRSPKQRMLLAPYWVTVVHHLQEERITSPCCD